MLLSSFVVYLLEPEEDVFLSKALVHYCFLEFWRIGEYISLDLFYFVFFGTLDVPFEGCDMRGSA